MVKFRDFKKKVEKNIDAWSEVLITDPISTPLSFLFSKIKGRWFPYFLTFLSFVLRVLGAIGLYIGKINLGALLIFLSIIVDGMDGKISRWIYKKDPEKRGTLDFLLDQIGLGVLFICLGMILRQNGILSLLFLVYIASFYILMSFISTKFRLYGILKIDSKKSLLKQRKENNKLIKLIKKIQDKLLKFRIIFHPSSVDAEFLVFIVFPLWNFNLYVLILAILFVWVDTLISGIGPLYILFKK